MDAGAIRYQPSLKTVSGLRSTPNKKSLSEAAQVLPNESVVLGKTSSSAPLVPSKSLNSKSLEGLDTALRQSVEHVEKTQGSDGIWRTHYAGGLFQDFVSSIGLNYIGVQNQEFFQEERDLFRSWAKQQSPDGGFKPFPEGQSSPTVTRLFLAAAKQARKNGNPHLKDDPQLALSLFQAESKAEAFLKQSKPEKDNFMLQKMGRLVTELVEPTKEGLGLDPFHALPSTMLLHSKAGKKVAEQLAATLGGMLPGLALLSSQRAEQEEKNWLETGLHKLVRPSEKTLAKLESDVLRTQDGNGGWLLVPLATSLNAMALKNRGYHLHSEPLRKATQFVRGLRTPGEDGSTQQSWCNAECWDTALAGSLLLSDGVKATDPKIEKPLKVLIEEQCPDGRWAFASQAQGVPDTDSSSMILRFVAQTHATASAEMKPQVAETVRKAVDGILDKQQKDGGWNAFEPTSLRWGKRVPGALEAMAVDPSTPDVTGRVLISLAASRRAGVLTEEQCERLDASIGKAENYLKKSQNSNGSWWARWIAGFLPSPTFVLTGLRANGVDSKQPYIEKNREFLLERQNQDGGWGETVKADSDTALAGKGESTPAQTAFALLALMGSNPDEKVFHNSEALERGVNYLLKTQENGTWKNGQHLYTMGPDFEYYDSDFNTHLIVGLALRCYKNCQSQGVQKGLEATL